MKLYGKLGFAAIITVAVLLLQACGSGGENNGENDAVNEQTEKQHGRSS